MAFDRGFNRGGYGDRDRGYGGDRGFRSFTPAPVKEGQEVDVKIEALGEKGDGIAKVDGFVLFIPNTKVGDEVRVKITRVLRKVGFAEVVGQASGPVKTSEKPEKAEEKEEMGEEKEAEEEEVKPAKAKKAKKEEKKEEVKEEPAEKEASFEEEEETEGEETF
jgi:predicted RNA-binding protein with TRAM domain